MSVRTRVAAIAVALTLLVSGCSSTNGSPMAGGFLGLGGTSNAAAPGAAAGANSGSGSGSGSGDAGLPSLGAGGFGFNSACLGVLSAHLAIALALVPALTGGQGTYDAGKLSQAIASLGGSVPAELKPDFDTLSNAAKSASGKSLSDAGAVLGSPEVTKASDAISAWVSKNCGG